MLKNTELGSNASNMILGAFGVVFNLFAHALVRYAKVMEPGFFDGYNNRGISVVIMMTLLGLISTVASKRELPCAQAFAYRASLLTSVY